ncbi:hypothetical protein LCGC14_1341700 [marine sediment metagenome]|uniref:Uncharacterized protein n=1 Tax=marine sediment metagenome TaxID=412755 RepID=A0A0F9MUG6_9ZZZZ
MSTWPPGVSDGLVLPCAICGLHPKFDFRVTDECWQAVLGKAEYRRGVVCLPCFDRLATEKRLDVSRALIEVQFTGIGKTIILKPQSTHRYKSPSAEAKP